jgi:thymidine kinase
MLEVVCGPMFSGKSEELIRRMRRAKIARQSVLVFKPALDTRGSVEYVSSHNGTAIEAISVPTPAHIYEQALTRQATVIGIDEVQFFTKDIISVICALLDAHKRVIVAGLDLDFRGVPFGPMPTLLAIADKITKLQAICTECGHDAHFTQRLVDNVPAKHDDPIILVGAQEAYQARCRDCYRIDRSPHFI